MRNSKLVHITEHVWPITLW